MSVKFAIWGFFIMVMFIVVFTTGIGFVGNVIIGILLGGLAAWSIDGLENKGIR